MAGINGTISLNAGSIGNQHFSGAAADAHHRALVQSERGREVRTRAAVQRNFPGDSNAALTPQDFGNLLGESGL